MKILFLATHLNVGGIVSYIFTLARGLKKRGHKVYLASGGGKTQDRFLEEGIDLVSVPIKTKSEISPKILLSRFKLVKYIRENGIDVIHSNTRVTQVLACLLSRATRKPHISTCHGFFKNRFSRRIFPCWGKKVIAISESVKEHLVKDLGVNEGSIRLIYSGVDLNKFSSADKPLRQEAKKNIGLGSGPVIGIIARLSGVKGHAYLIEAMQYVLKEFSQAGLLVVGEGPLKGELLRLTRKLQIEKNVLFLPNSEDPSLLLSAMDIFVMPSLEEGLGLGLMEAMAAGLAVIGSQVGGIRNLIQDNLNGLLVRPADSLGLASAIKDLLADTKKRACLADNARNFIRDNFPQEKMVLETERLYLECLGLKD